MNNIFNLNALTVVFTDDSNGFPDEILLPETFGRMNLLAEKPGLFITLGDGRSIHVANVPKTTVERYHSRQGAEIIEFQQLGFKAENQSLIAGLHFSIRHEIYPDGTIFCNAFFMSDSCNPPDIAAFEVKYKLALKDFENLRWGLSYRPRELDGTVIQTAAPERGLEPDSDRNIEAGIFPLTSFNCYSKSGPSLYTEIFMEGDNVLSNNKDNNSSSVQWIDGNPELCWNFQNTKADSRNRPWQWRNSWGMVIAPAPQERHLPPFTMYHYFDNSKRYPTNEALQAIADSGADVLIMHENWRLDPQNGGIPYDTQRMREVIDFAHYNGIRVAPYIRGNEDSITEQDGDWFDKYFQKDFDGLYMDYGGPFHYSSPPDESFHSGKINFRKHYLQSLKRRKIVGDDGIVLSHTGPMFSALGMTDGCIDGYVSGEGERGLLIKSRLDHAYYSMSAVCPGTMWTAAFPEYSGKQMIPFLAATGQSPHSTLGVQVLSSSLVHPPAPGVNDVNFRPLWKLWRLFRDERNIRILNDYNCSGIFPQIDLLSHYMMISSSKQRAMIIYANFSAEKIKVDTKINWCEAGFDISGTSAWLCTPNVRFPGKPVKCVPGENFELEAYGVAAVCVSHEDFGFGDYEKSYTSAGEECRKYLDNLDEQQRLRYQMKAADNWFLQVSVPQMPVAYEESMIWDLYDNRFELGEIIDGKFNSIGFLGKNGFQKEPTEREDFVWPGEYSVWFDMKKILGSGKKHLAILSTHRGDLYYVGVPFYSFLKLALKNAVDDEAYTLEFRNELESDRAYLHFDLEIKE